MDYSKLIKVLVKAGREVYRTHKRNNRPGVVASGETTKSFIVDNMQAGDFVYPLRNKWFEHIGRQTADEPIYYLCKKGNTLFVIDSRKIAKRTTDIRELYKHNEAKVNPNNMECSGFLYLDEDKSKLCFIGSPAVVDKNCSANYLSVELLNIIPEPYDYSGYPKYKFTDFFDANVKEVFLINSALEKDSKDAFFTCNWREKPKITYIDLFK